MQGRLGKPLFLATVAGAVAALVLLVAAQGASAGLGASCQDGANSASFTFEDDQAVKGAASYNDDFMGGDKVAMSYRETNGEGFGASSCTEDDSPFANILITLGNLDDRARLDATRPASFDSQATEPVPSYVAVTVDAGAGDDRLLGHKGLDTMLGRRGRDVIDVAGGGQDSVDCGAGIDTAIALGNDDLSNCEEVAAPGD